MQTKVDKKVADKLRGGYYTPKPIAEFICKWGITSIAERVLEPSCGDGNFIEAAIKRFLELGAQRELIYGHIKGVEFLESEAAKAKMRAGSFGVNSDTIINSDFFEFLESASGQNAYDVILGNPPFIRYQNFPPEHRERAFSMMKEMGLNPNKLTNIWVPFLVLSANALNKSGKLGMVIPAELFQVKYAAETRVFLSKFFPRITIITFKKLVFSDIQQEVVLLLCEKDVEQSRGIRVVELDTLDDLSKLKVEEIHRSKVKTLDHSSEKWTKYFLEEEEIDLLRRVKGDSRIGACKDFMSVDVGIVTGRNDFFMLSRHQVEQWGLEQYTQKVVSRSAHLKGLLFTEADFTSNLEADLTCYLFIPPNVDFEELPEACKKYILFGEAQGYNTGYKCRIRKRWYITPSLRRPNAFALRQVGDYPKLIVNETDASSTDTIHRASINKGYCQKSVALSFLNSMTFAFSEILGRSYGGGVLTFEPTEIEEIPLPFFEGPMVDFGEVDKMLREKRIDEVLDLNDQAILVERLGFKKKDVLLLRSIWKKLSDRRNGRKL
ncbi:class I SAM-dependent methyltransferase [Flaviaesturariibacter terrae]